MLKCKKCKSNEIRVRIIDNNSNFRTKIFICKICDFQESEKINIQLKRNTKDVKFTYFNFNGTEYK